MEILQCRGYELEKEKKNTSEDFFNRSEITLKYKGQEKIVSVLYLRYFDEIFQQFVPYEADPLFIAGDRSVYFKDIVAVCALLTHPEYKERKRIYVNSQEDFQKFFQNVDFKQVEEIFQKLEQGSTYSLTEQKVM